MSTDKRTALSFDTRTVLKENEVFLVCDLSGDIQALSKAGQGLYFRDTRFLSVYEMSVDEMEISLLSSSGDQSFMGNLQFANNTGVLKDGTRVEPRTVSVRRNRFIRDGLHERIGFYSFNPFPVDLTVRLTFGSDFRDMFDVRGYAHRTKYGVVAVPTAENGSIWLNYQGLDGIIRRTQITFESSPTAVEVVAGEESPARVRQVAPVGEPRADVRVNPPRAVATFRFTLAPREPFSITLHVLPMVGAVNAPVVLLDDEYTSMSNSYRDWAAECSSVSSDNELFDSLVRRAQNDIRLLLNDLPSGALPVAGIPWFSVPFGRDSLITSFQTLMLHPDIARGSLRFLAECQGTQFDDWRDEEPGKIVHEVRLGEMSQMGEVPYDSYYGTADATPLFLILLSEYFKWTGDWVLLSELRDPMEAALEWVRRHGDLNGDGFIEYLSRSRRGLRNQGWKDSANSVAWRNGDPAEPPIALVELQGYAYDARMRVAGLLEVLGEGTRAAELRAEAATLAEQFDARFWLANEQFYALALDKDGKPVPAVTSNPGHGLWSGIIPVERAEVVVHRLMAPDMLSGWGVRTMSSGEPNFNPMSYHNGSVWPHDNSLIMAGLRRYGYNREANELFTQVYEAGLRFGGYRLPELYCGFDRDRHYQSMPAQYPVSCSPQAWSAGAVFLMLQQCLGLRPDAPNSTLYVKPLLPSWLNRLSVRRLKIAGECMDLTFTKDGDEVRLDVSNAGGVKIVQE